MGTARLFDDARQAGCAAQHHGPAGACADLQAPLSLGAMISFFALCLSCINAGGRVIFAMGRHGIFHSATATAHDKNETPHIAVTLMALVAFVVPVLATFNHVATLDLFNYVGTCAAFGFLVPYVLITIAAPVYLKIAKSAETRQYGRLRRFSCAARHPRRGLGLSSAAGTGNVFPVPLFAYLAVGIVWILTFYRRQPSRVGIVRQDLQLAHDSFSGMAAGGSCRRCFALASRASGDAAAGRRFCTEPDMQYTLWEAGQCRDVHAHEGESLMVALKRAGLGCLRFAAERAPAEPAAWRSPPDWLGRWPQPTQAGTCVFSPISKPARTSVCPARSR